MKIELCKKVLSGRFSGVDRRSFVKGQFQQYQAFNCRKLSFCKTSVRDSGVQYMRRSEEFVEDEENNDTQTRTSAIFHFLKK